MSRNPTGGGRAVAAAILSIPILPVLAPDAPLPGAWLRAAQAADDLPALRAKARALRDANRDRESIAVFDAILALAPEDGVAYRERALARWWSLSAPASDWGAPDGTENFAWFQARMCRDSKSACDEVDRVLADFGRAITLLPDPQRAGTLHDRAMVLLERGEAARALADCDEAVRLRPDVSAFRSRRAQARLQLGDRTGALTDLDAVLTSNDDPADRVRRARIRREAGDRDGARADLDEALRRPADEAGRGWRTEARRLRRELAKPGEADLDEVVLTVARAEPGLDGVGQRIINVTLDAASAKRFAAFTTAQVGARTQVLVDGTVIMEPVIRSPITGGALQILLETTATLRQTQGLAARLRTTKTIEVRVAD